MQRAHVTFDDGQEVEVLVQEFNINSGPGCVPEIRMEGLLTTSSIRVPPITELTVTKVIYNDPATIVYWSDKTRTVVKCQPGDKFDPELGFLLAICKRVCGNTGAYNELLREHVPGCGSEKTEIEPNIEQMREELCGFCKRMSCSGCPMGRDGFECGVGKFFTIPAGEPGHMTDESIVRHYRAMKGAKS